jgi:hypothetical protein
MSHLSGYKISELKKQDSGPRLEDRLYPIDRGPVPLSCFKRRRDGVFQYHFGAKQLLVCRVEEAIVWELSSLCWGCRGKSKDGCRLRIRQYGNQIYASLQKHGVELEVDLIRVACRRNLKRGREGVIT